MRVREKLPPSENEDDEEEEDEDSDAEPVEVPLPKGLSPGEPSVVQDRAWYAANGITLLTGLALVDAQLDNQTLFFAPVSLSSSDKTTTPALEEVGSEATDKLAVAEDNNAAAGEAFANSPEVVPEDDADAIVEAGARKDVNTSPAQPGRVALRYNQVCVGTGLQPQAVPGPGPQPGWAVDCAIISEANDNDDKNNGGDEAIKDDAIVNSTPANIAGAGNSFDDRSNSSAAAAAVAPAGGGAAAAAALRSSKVDGSAVAASSEGSLAVEATPETPKNNGEGQEGVVAATAAGTATTGATALVGATGNGNKWLALAKDDPRYGFGSAHYCGDVGDATKLVHALSRPEDDGQDICFDPVLVVGGGPLALEVISTLLDRFPDLPLVLVLPHQHILPELFGGFVKRASSSAGSMTGGGGGGGEEQRRESLESQESDAKGTDAGGGGGGGLGGGGGGGGACEEVASFYEQQLVKRGVKLAKGFTVSRLWPTQQAGNLATLDGPPTGLKATRPRLFGPAPTQFVQSRGLVFVPTAGAPAAAAAVAGSAVPAPNEIFLPARLSIICTEPVPSVPPCLVNLLPTSPPLLNNNNNNNNNNNGETAPWLDNQAEAPQMAVPPAAASAVASSGGALVVDARCVTTHSSGKVFACGGCAVYPCLTPDGYPLRAPALPPLLLHQDSSRSHSSGNGGGSSHGRRKKKPKNRPGPALYAQAASFELATQMARFAAQSMVESAAAAVVEAPQNDGDQPLREVKAASNESNNTKNSNKDDGSTVAVGRAVSQLPAFGDACNLTSSSSVDKRGSSPAAFAPVPMVQCEMLELNWRFAGVTGLHLPSYYDNNNNSSSSSVASGQSLGGGGGGGGSGHATCVLVGDTAGYPKFFACVWVLDHRLVGIFLEGARMQAHVEAMHLIASARPRIINTKKLKKVSLEALLANPFCLEPPPLGVGEFLAETDEDAVYEAFRAHDLTGGGVAKTSSLSAIMAELGADWDEDELAEALAALDPSGGGSVSYDAFRAWWLN